MSAHNPLIFHRSALAAAVMVLSACTTPDKTALDEYAPKSSDAVIEAVSLSASDNDTFDPNRVGTEFPDTTKQVAVWYRWKGADSGKKVGIRWSKAGNVILEQGDTLANASGASAFVLKMAAASNLPVDDYQVELLEDGVGVTTIPFKIGTDAETAEAAAAPSNDDDVAAEAKPAPAEEPEQEPAAVEPQAAEAAAEAPGEEVPTTPTAAPSAGGAFPAAQETKWPGVTVQVTEFARKGKNLNAKLRFANNGTKQVRPGFYYTGTYLLDADNRKYEVLKDDKDRYLGSLHTGYKDWWGETIEPGSSLLVWMRFPAPPPEVNMLTVQLDGMDPIEDVPIQN
jgi:hypothetical protein